MGPNPNTDEVISIAQMAQNSQISQTGGAAPKRGVCGRAPRLPTPAAKTATLTDTVNGEGAPGTKTQKAISAIIKARGIWLTNDANAKLKTGMYRAPRKCRQIPYFGQ